MADRLSLGAVQVMGNDPMSINVALQALVDRIDTVAGLRGRSRIYDAVQIEEPEQDADAAQRVDTEGNVTIPDEQEIEGTKTFIDGALLRFEDDTGTLIHAWGTIV